MLSNMHGRGFEFGWEKRFGFGWEKGFDIQWYGMEMEKPEGAACEQACRGKDGRIGFWFGWEKDFDVQRGC